MITTSKLPPVSYIIQSNIKNGSTTENKIGENSIDKQNEITSFNVHIPSSKFYEHQTDNETLFLTQPKALPVFETNCFRDIKSTDDFVELSNINPSIELDINEQKEITKQLEWTQQNAQRIVTDLVNNNTIDNYNSDQLKDRTQKSLLQGDINNNSNQHKTKHLLPRNSKLRKRLCKELIEKLADKTELKCKFCKKYFKSICKLNRHITTVHMDFKLYECEICHCSFKSNDTLKSHYLVHNNNRPFKCEICDKRFKSITYLNTHIKTHSVERLFKCNICNKAFKRKHHRVAHYKIHFSEKLSFKCDICDKSFSAKILLTRHHKSHYAVKSFKCEVCLESFSTNKKLTWHLKKHLLNKPMYRCQICNKVYFSTNGLKRHEKKHIN